MYKKIKNSVSLAKMCSHQSGREAETLVELQTTLLRSKAETLVG